MNRRDGGTEPGEDGGGFFASRANLVLLVFLAVAGFYLVSEHWAHLVGVGPLLLLLGLCIGMHFFMHGSHGGHGGHGANGANGGEDDPLPDKAGQSGDPPYEAPERRDPR